MIVTYVLPSIHGELMRAMTGKDGQRKGERYIGKRAKVQTLTWNAIEENMKL